MLTDEEVDRILEEALEEAPTVEFVSKSREYILQLIADRAQLLANVRYSDKFRQRREEDVKGARALQ